MSRSSPSSDTVSMTTHWCGRTLRILGEGFAAVHDGHVEVEQDDVGVGLAHGFDAGEAV